MAASETESDTVQADGQDIRNSGAGADPEEARPSQPPDEKDATGEKPPPTGNAVAEPNLVDWDGPNDPANPRNWSKARKMWNIGLVSLSVLYSYVSTNPITPVCSGLRRLAADTVPDSVTSPRPCSRQVRRPWLQSST